MNNDQTLTGDTVANPRAIPSLPFSVTDGIARFSDSLTHPCAKSAGSSAGTSRESSLLLLFLLLLLLLPLPFLIFFLFLFL